MRLIHSIPTLSRNAGGLPPAACQLCEHELGSDRSVEIITVKIPGGDRIPVHKAIRVMEVERGPGFGRLNLSAGRFYQRLAQESEKNPVLLIHQHGIWRQSARGVSSFAARKGVTLIWSPHGMLEPWALGYHAWKKKTAWWLYQNRALQRARALHATAESEACQLRELGFKQPVVIQPNGVPPAPVTPLDPKALAAPKDRRIALFLSRIHPKKGIPMLLDAWAKLKPADWELVIAGNDEGNFLPALKSRAERLGLGADVRFSGPLFKEAKDTIYRQADLFVLPTYSENFGIVIAEALQYGVPVLTTTGAPWSDLQADSCGWWVEPTVEAITTALEDAISRSDSEREEMGRRGMALIDRKYRWPGIGEEMVAFYQWMLGNGAKPACVFD